MRRWFQSLNAQLFLWAVMPVMLTITALVTASVYIHQREMQEFVSSRDLSLVYAQARMVAHLVEQGRIDASGGGLAPWMDSFAQDMPAVMVIDRNGTLLAHSEKDRIGTPLADIKMLDLVLSQVMGSSVVRTGDSMAVVSYALVPDTDWHVIMSEEVNSFISSTLRYSLLGPLIASLAVAVSLFIIGFNWFTVVRPLRMLAESADQITWNAYPEIPSPEGSVQEVETLHRAMVAMIRRIRSYEASLREYLGATTLGQEEERARIAREIHDGPVQEIIALGQRLDMLRSYLTQNNTDDITKLLNEMRDTQMKTVEELRRIVNDLRPVYLEDLGFIPALEMLAQQANNRDHVHVHLKVIGKVQRLPFDIELAAYRITQEALNNALQHAAARKVWIEVACNENGLHLSISDDGHGFSPPEHLDDLAKSGRFGLLGIRERVELLAGSVELDANPHKGTRVTVMLPGCAPGARG